MEKLFRRLEERGYKTQIVPIKHLDELKEEIEDRHRKDLFDEEFYRERLTWFVFNPAEDFPKAESIIVVSVPQSQIQHIFNWKGKSKSLVVPPTYSTYPNR
jgi:epoxyqueuosine reductase QueG